MNQQTMLPLLLAPLVPESPRGWLAFCHSRELRERPLSREILGERVVVYRTRGGVAAMDGACWHMGADLGQGEVQHDCIRCPFHGWAFDSSGACVDVPACGGALPQARQQIWDAAEQAQTIYVFPAPRASHPLPFFDGLSPSDLVAAPPFTFELDCPWWLIGTNGFDLQHFARAHDRQLVAPPILTTPHFAARRIEATFEVVGTPWRDRLTRRFAGRFVTMDVTMWAGTLALVKASFRNEIDGPVRSVSLGQVQITPLSECRSRVSITIRVRRGFGAWLGARVRSLFIAAFLRHDVRILDGIAHRIDHLISPDTTMQHYLSWLSGVSRGDFSQEQA